MQAKPKDIGYFGEKKAAEYLRSKGYEILDLNFTVRGGEIDIVACDKNILVFVEVKTRTQENFGEGNESVDTYKAKKLMYAIQRYIDSKVKKQNPDYRLDLIEIELYADNGVKNINHFEDIEF